VIRPPPLAPGDVVRVIAPAGPFDAARFERGLAILRDRLGLRPRFREDVAARERYLAGPDPRRAAEWREAVEDDAASAIFCARGGYGSMRILPTIDPRPLLDRPKLFMGFSDVTAIHATLNRAGLCTVHGPGVAQLALLPEEPLEHLRALLFGEAPAPSREAPPAPGAGLVGTETLRAGHATGPLLGGNLTLLSHLAGTPYLPSLDGAILYLEDIGEAPYRLDRNLTQLRLAGLLDRVAGVAVGQFTRCDDAEADLYGLDVVREAVRDLGVPAVAGLPAGHEDTNFALPLGARVTLVAPGPGDGGVPRLLFDEGATE
jgi:muramoyltetrapeptide carboxypeptidase